MNTLHVTRHPPFPSPRHGVLHRTPGTTPSRAAPFMPDVFRSSGGMLPADQLASMMRDGTSQPVSQLARWIVARSIVTVSWCGTTMVPLFQFNPGLDGLRPGLGPVLAELEGVFDDDELALWFASPNSSLGGGTPAAVLAYDAHAVREAARLDRFIAAG